jgi:hypothetical protein
MLKQETNRLNIFLQMIYFPIIGFYKFVFFGWYNAKYTPRTQL